MEDFGRDPGSSDRFECDRLKNAKIANKTSRSCDFRPS